MSWKLVFMPTSTAPRTKLAHEWRSWQLAQGLSERTVTDRLTVVERIARETETDPSELSATQIVLWLAARGHWSAGTRATYHASLRAWFRWLVEQDHRADDPMGKTGRPKRPRGQPRPIRDDHMVVLLRTRMHRRTRAMILLAALAGLRVHEIAKLHGQDVDLIGGQLTVRGKGGTTATVPLHPLLADLATSMPRRGYWFPSPAADRVGEPIQARSVSQIITRVLVRADIPATAHGLRHWFGSTLVDDGADLRSAQTLLRHASLATTQIYTAVSDRRTRAAVNRLDLYRGESATA